MAKIFEYAVILEEKRDKENEVVEEAALVVPITPALARDEAQAQMLASRAIPDDMMDKLDRLTVVVRPF